MNSENWLYGNEFKAQLGIRDPDLTELILSKVILAYSEDLKPFSVKEFREMLRNPYRDLSSWAFKRFDGLLFRSADVEKAKKHLGIDIETEPPEQEKKGRIIPCSPGTNWEDIKITLIAKDTVRVKTPEGEERLTYHELGLSDKRKGDSPKALWELLTIFCKSDGDISPKGNKYIEYLPDQTKRLNKHLKDLFGIPDSIYVDHYKKLKGYKTKIKFFDETHSSIERPTKESLQDDILDESEEI